MDLIDFHAHVFMHPQKSYVFERSGDILIVETGLDPATNKIVGEEANNYENVYCAFGLHPTNVQRYSFRDLVNMLNELSLMLEANHEKLLAVGEVGLDYYWVREEALREKQRSIFENIIELANEHKLPIVIHSRNAEHDLPKFVEKVETIAILHSYMGRIRIAQKLLENGNVYFSIPAIIWRNQNLQRLVEIIPVEKLLTETDTPFLSPLKNIRNEPKFVEYGVRKIAEVKGMETEEMKKIIKDNFERILEIKI